MSAARDGGWPLAGRAALVTGASTGIGRAIALELGSRGASVAVTSRSAERGDAVAREIRAAGGVAVALEVELTDLEQAARLVPQATAALGGLEILVNNAGAGQAADTLTLPLADWQRIITLDLTAPFVCSQAAGRVMSQRGGGVIVNVASILGHVGIGGRAAYASAKHGLRGLTKVLAVEWARHGVRALSIDPGYVATEFLVGTMATGAFSEDDVARRTPLGRLARPHEVAKVVAFAVSDDAAYVTGSSVLVDGGWIAEGGWT
jgi:NAD(P)-dependent dehydrogenase (short-subunit alcohol dehydrogenase family)